MTREQADAERPLPYPFSLSRQPQAESPLLHTKLRVPGTTATLLPRPRLINQLQQRPNGYLTLVSAPAGFGKTTLVADWVGQQDEPVAWLTLDEQDNDPTLFWRYLVAALQVVDERIGQRAQASLAAVGRVSLETAVTLLINDIVTYNTPGTMLTLILDDFHWVRNAVIHQSINYLLQHQPAQLHLLFLTRADPPLPLARLRVEGRLVELRANDLRLTRAEMSAFLTQVQDLTLSDDDLGLLVQHTEGWAAGVQLVALSLRQHDAAETAHIVQTFAGVREHIFSYLMEEVLAHQPDGVRQFLQQTAVLRQFCGPLCTAVTGLANATTLLHKLAADNLFITPLDDEGKWYRYHPLFAEMLCANLEESTRRECHRQAANWYAEQKLLQEAMRNALAAQDYAFMAELLSGNYKTFLADGLLVSLQKWLTTLPEAYQTPRLRLAAAWCRVYEGNEPQLQQNLNTISQDVPQTDEPIQGEILAVRAVYVSLYGQPHEAIEWAAQALKLIDPVDHLSLVAAYLALGNAYRYLSELDAALAAYTQAREHFIKMGHVFMEQLPLYRMASIYIMQGRLQQAWHIHESIRLQAQKAGLEPLIVTGEIYGYLSDLHWEWNELDQAAAYARQEIELAQSGQILLALVDGYLKLAAATAAQGHAQAAKEALDLAGDTAAQLQSPPVSAQVAMYQARLNLSLGNQANANAWADKYSTQRESRTSYLAPLLIPAADMLLARIRLAQNQPAAALELLQEILHQSETVGRIRLVAEANVLQALAWRARHESNAAQKALIRALALAKEEGYIRVFVENGQALVPLLNQVRHLFPHFVSRILKALSSAPPSSAAFILLDPITTREQEILSLIAKGYSNRQIAEALFISVGTVKGHLNHLFSKLDVENRTQALVRAREMNLLP